MQERHFDSALGDTHRFPRTLTSFLLVALVATIIDISAARVLDRVPLDPLARIAVALLPLPGNLTLLVMVLRRIRRLDEFQKRIHFEAVVVAFLATGIAVFVYGYLQKAHAVGPFNVLFIWAFMACFYGVGYAVAVRHYR
jgi:hypothetical protein